MKINNLKTKNSNSFLILISLIFISFFFFSFIPSVSASSMISPIPDLCIPYNVSYFDIWLEDYYSIDVDEEINIRYVDPINGLLVTLPVNHATLNLECFEMAYYFQCKNPSDPECLTTDLLRLSSYDDDCEFDLLLMFESNEGLDQSFTVNIVEDCYVNDSDPPPSYNYTISLFDNLIAYYPFDGDAKDHYNNYDLSVNDTNIGISFSGNSVKGLSTNSQWNFPSNMFPSISNDEEYSVAFWYYKNNSGDYANSFTCHNNTQANVLQYRIDNNDNYIVPFFDGSGPSQSSKPDDFQFIVVTYNSTYMTLIVNGTSYYTDYRPSTNFSISECVLNYHSNSANNVFIDEMYIFNRQLNITESLLLYNNGNGYSFSEVNSPYSPTISTISDIEMNQNSSIILDLDSYIDSWDDLYVQVTDPFTNYQYKLYTGYATALGDYYDLSVNSSGHLNITSYGRPYVYDIDVYACNYSDYQYCSSESFQVTVNGTLNSVVQLNQFVYSVNLGFRDSYTFPMNYYFQYYEGVIFSFPDSNYTGILDSDFEYNYTTIANPVLNASYMVFLECEDISDPLFEYNYLGDLNITMECGNNTAYYTTTAYNNYNQRVTFYAYNSFSHEDDYLIILSGNPDVATGYTPSLTQLNDSTTDLYDEYIGTFSEILPSGLTSSQKIRMFLVISLVLVVVVFIMTVKFSTMLAIILSFITFILTGFVFASAGFINVAIPVILLIALIFYGIIKLFRGGS